MHQQDRGNVLGRSHRVEGNGDPDVVGIGIGAGHGSHSRFGNGPSEKEETQQAVQEAHRGSRQKGQRGVDAERGPYVAPGHHGEEQRRVGDVEGGAGQSSLHFRGEQFAPDGQVAHGNDCRNDEDAGDDAAHPAPFRIGNRSRLERFP